MAQTDQDDGNQLGPQNSQNGARIQRAAGHVPQSNGPAPKCWQSDTPTRDGDEVDA